MREFLEAGIGGWVALATVAALLIIYELGDVLGRRRHNGAREARKAQADLLVPSLLGLLSLLLAFSLNIVQNRFDRRKALLLDDANAIGTTYLRAKTLPPPYDREIEALLHEYISFRVEARDPEALQVALVRSGKIHTQLWTQATAVARANPDSVVVGRFLESLNYMIDLHTARVTVGLYQRMPRAILWMLFFVSALAVGMAGFRAGLDRSRAVIPIALLVLAITAVLAMIVDLDRPGSRMFPISQGAMEDVRQSMMQDVQ